MDSSIDERPSAEIRIRENRRESASSAFHSENVAGPQPRVETRVCHAKPVETG